MSGLRQELLVSGFGGQGVVRVGQIVGLAAVKQGYRVSMLKSHGTEQRGGYVRVQVVISDQPVDSPLVEDPDLFCAMSTAAYNRFIGLMGKGLVLYDPSTVVADEQRMKTIRHLSVPAKDKAVEVFGQPLYANVVMLGVIAREFKMLDQKILKEAMLETVPKFKEDNAKAFDIGLSLVGAG